MMLEKTTDITTICCHKSVSNSIAIPLAINPVPDNKQEINPILRVILSSMNFENTQEPSGQVIPGFSSNIPAHCPEYK